MGPTEAAPDLSVLQDELLVLLLEKAANTNIQLEELLLRVRRELLARAKNGGLRAALGEGGGEFLSALAQQCFLNEYVYFETQKETQQVTELFEGINEGLKQRRQLDGGRLALLATYRPLWKLAFAPQILRYYEPSTNDFLYKVIRLQLIGPAIEKGLQEEVPRLTGIRDQTSLSVQAQYEENPYPRWLFMDHHVPSTVVDYMASLFPHLSPVPPWRESPHVLVAGCGTGKQAISAAMRFADSTVLAIDLSRTSLVYGLRMARELNVSNIEYAQADILETAQIERSFDVIECVGVLHHMREPKLGWRILSELLSPGGLMRVGLYSRTARRTVTLAREFANTNGYLPTPADIRKFRRQIIEMPHDEPLSELTAMADFYTTSECRDLVFHVQERDFGLPDIAETLDELGLEFLGFEMPGERAFFQYAEAYPDDPAAIDLVRWQQFEQDYPDTFSSMYQFWARKP